LSFVYAHVSRLIRHTGQPAIYLAGPGHGGPALVAACCLEGTYSEVYPAVSQDEAGMLRLFRQFSSPGGIPSHVSVTTPGSIHEGGELGYVQVHAFGSVMDNPDLLAIAIAVVGDGEAETGPGRRPAGHAPPLRRRPGRGVGVDPRDPDGGPRRRPGRRPAAVAADRAALAEGLDRAGGGRRGHGDRHLALAPGAAVRGPRQSGAPGDPGAVAAVVPPGGATRSR
jgi:hypothetical protein